MRRREFITIVGGSFLWPLAVRAQQAGSTKRDGLLATGGVAAMDERSDSIREGLAANGFFEGRNLEFDGRSGEGRSERLSEFAAALQAANVDAIVTFGYPAAAAAKTSATEIPVVVTGAGDPVATGLADSLARPGGHVTGMTELSTELSGNRLEILKAPLPTPRRAAILSTAPTPS